MTPNEKIYEDLKEWFIVNHGNRFLKLSNQKQHEKIISSLKIYDKVKID